MNEQTRAKANKGVMSLWLVADLSEFERIATYTANALNQYERRTVLGYAGVRGTATNTATVTVNGNPAWRLDEYFYGGDSADNSLAAVMKQLAITAVYNPPGTNTPDIVTSQTGRVFVAQTPEQFQYDEDGNLTQDGRFTYTWDAENRLISATTRADLPASVPRIRVEYAYDHQFRRIASATATWTNNVWQAVESHAFLYDGWNVVQETINHQPSTTNYYTWGLDLSGSLQGAGGIGGLLSASLDGTTAFYCYDANGNVGQLIGTDGELLAHYEYSPFGETIVSAGLLADMEAWAAGHPAEFAKRKSLELMHGVIGFRTGTPRVTLPRKADEEELAAALEAAGLGDYVRRRIELDRERIRAAVADPAEDNEAEAVLATYGIRVRQSERFFAEVREEQVAGQA